VVTPTGFDNATKWFLGLQQTGTGIFSADGGTTWLPDLDFGGGPLPTALDVWIQ
jgi:hypothetical protein